MADSKRVKIPIKTYLVYLILVTFLVTGVTFSRFITTVTGGDSATVARPIIEFTLTDETILEGEKSVFNLAPISMKPGDEIHYTVIVDNEDVTKKITEVALSYTISVGINYKDNPHENSTYPIDAQIYLSDDPFTRTLANKPYTFGVQTAQQKEFILVLLWDDENVYDYDDYAGDIYTVTITLSWEQRVSG